jgi:integrase
MNITESNHIPTDLGIPTWTQNPKQFPTQAPKILIHCLSPSKNFGLWLALYTGQRQGDLLALTWSAYDGQVITLRQSKTGTKVSIPVTRKLHTILETDRRAGDISNRGSAFALDSARRAYPDTAARFSKLGTT